MQAVRKTHFINDPVAQNPNLPSQSSWPLPRLIHHGRAAYGPTESIGPACWPHYDLILVVSGEVTLSTRGKQFACEKDSGLLIPPGCPIEGKPSDCGCAIWVQHFTFEETPALIRLPRAPRLLVGLKSPWAQSLMRRISELHHHSSTRSARDEQAVLFSLLLSTLLKGSDENISLENETQRRIRKLRDELRRTSFPLPDVTTLAHRMEWSASHLRAKFREVEGQSLGKFLQSLRMAEARRLLAESNRPVKEISPRLGYSDPVAFHRAFQQHSRQTPGEFRRSARKIA